MSEENVEIVRRAYEAFMRGDRTVMAAALDPNIVTHRAPPQPDAGTWHGPAGIEHAYESWVEAFDEFTMTLEEAIDAAEDTVILKVHQRAVGSRSRAPIEADFWLVHTLEGGRITRLDIFPTEEAAREAAAAPDR